MEEITKILRNIQEDMLLQKTEIRDMKESITKTINDNINEKFYNIEARNKQLEERIDEQEIIINKFDRYMRRNNLIFFGVEEEERGYNDLAKIILSIINNDMKIECNKFQLESVRRLGKRREKARPVVVTLTNTHTKIALLKNKNSLENTGIYIKQDFPPQVLKKRKELKVELEEARTQGKRAVLRYDKLVILTDKKSKEGNNYTNTSKRNLSASPETAQQSELHDKPKQPTKKIRNDMKHYFTKPPKVNINN